MILLLQFRVRLSYFPAYRFVSLARDRLLVGRVTAGGGLAQQLSVLRENLSGLPHRPSASYLTIHFSYSTNK